MSSRFLFRLTICSLGLMSLSGSLCAQETYPLKLNSRLALGVSAIPPFKFSPDGSRLVYIASRDHLNMYELFSVPAGGGTSVKLHQGRVYDFEISSDGTRVVYRTSASLYSVPITGGTGVRLTGSIVEGGYINRYQVSPDGTRVVYDAEQETDGVKELYSVPIEGGAFTKLSSPLVTGGDVSNFEISPDGSRVVYRADQDVNAVYELYSVAIGGGAPVRLNATLVAGGDVDSGFSVSPNGSRVVYLADQSRDNVLELYSVALAGGTPVRLNGTLVTGGDVLTNFQISPNGSRVVFRADQGVDNVLELFSVSILGGTRVKLNGSLPVGGDVYSFEISPDGNWVVYLGDQDIDGRAELYRVALGGGGASKLNGPLVAGGRVYTYKVSPSGNRVAYLADQDVDNRIEIYSVSMSGGASAKLNAPLLPGENVAFGGSVPALEFSPDGNRVCYRVYSPGFGFQDVFQLYSSPVAGGVSVKLNGPLVPGGTVEEFLFNPDSTRVVYRADQEIDGVIQLFSVQAGGGGQTTLIEGIQGIAGDVVEAAFSPDGSRVVYRAAQDTGGVFELYSVSVHGGTPVKLNAPLAAGGDVARWFQFAPDGSRVVYLADQDTDRVFELYSVRVDGSDLVKLNGPLAPGGYVVGRYEGLQTGFEISPDGGKVFYQAVQDTSGYSEVYSVPIGGGGSEKLSGVLVEDGDVQDFWLSPDGSRIVYLADQDTDGVNELYAVLSTGGTPVRLNSPLVAGGDVAQRSVFIADGNRVVYLADQDADGVNELFSVSLTGGAPVKINGTLVANGDVNDFRVSPDGRRVVYRADQDTDGVSELWSKLVGSGNPVKLNGTLVAGGDVGRFEISPDGSRVVYQADQDVDAANELYSVPLEGGTQVKLNGTLAPGETMQYSFVISPDGSRVLYRSDHDTDGIIELYSVKATGGARVKLNGPIAPGGGVKNSTLGTLEECARFSPDGSRVFYRADVSGAGNDELYSVQIGGGGRVKINAPLVGGGDVKSEYRISPDGSKVLYTADQETDELFELYVWKGQAVWEAVVGNWFSSGNWRGDLRPDELIEAIINKPALVTVPGGATAVAQSLCLGGGGDSSVLDLSSGAILSLPGGAEVLAGGIIRGDGLLTLGSGSLRLSAGAELQVGNGERLAFQVASVSNAGRVDALGTPFDPAELQFSGAVTNEAATGAILGHNAILRFQQGLVNRGALVFGSGLNDVFGDIGNEIGGSLVVSGGAIAIFADDVINSSVINVSATAGIQSSAVFFGALTGNGVSGGGAVFIEGDSRPGFSPGLMSFGGDLSYGPLASLEIELGGEQAGAEHDQVLVAGHLDLSGTLTVTLLDGFVPAAGMVFDLWDAASVSGQFHTMDLPALPAGLFWHTAKLAFAGELRVGLTPETYEEFATHYGLVGGPDIDEENDGSSNLLEYLQARNPVESDSQGGVLRLERSGGEDHLRFLIAKPLGGDLKVELQTATTLQGGGSGGWEVIASRTGAASWDSPLPVVLNPAGDGRVEVLVTNPESGQSRRFYRLRLQLDSR